MTRKSAWPKDTKLQTTKISLPRPTWEAAKIRAMKEQKTLQEVVAEALDLHDKRLRTGIRLSKAGNGYRVRLTLDEDRAPFLALSTVTEIGTLLRLLDASEEEIGAALAAVRTRGAAVVREFGR